MSYCKEWAGRTPAMCRALTTSKWTKHLYCVTRQNDSSTLCFGRYTCALQKREKKSSALDALEIMEQQYRTKGSTRSCRSPLDFKECTTCAYLPVCGSGCAIHAKEQNGAYNTSFCGAVKQITSQRVLSYCERHYPEKMSTL